MQWRTLESMMATKRKKFTPEFKSEVVRLVLDGGRKVSEVAASHSLGESMVYGWVRQARIDAGQNPQHRVTTSERSELSNLRRLNKELERQNSFLKKTAQFLAEMKTKGSSL